MQHGPPRRRRARPVADAPTDALLLRVEDLAKGWLLVLVEEAPLEEAPAILASDVARDGPRLCAAVVRALADDADLERLEPNGALEPLASRVGEIAGAGGAERTARAVDGLAAVLWSAVRSELLDPDADQIAALSERLSLIMELVRRAALRHAVPEAAPNAGESASELAGSRGLREVGRDPASGAGAIQARRSWGGPQSAAGGPAPGPDALWKEALEDEIVGSEASGAPLSLLLVELEDADRVLALETPRNASVTFGHFAQAIRSAVRRQDILACETDARAWVIARDTGRQGAHALAGRMVEALSAAPPWRGAPLTLSVGLAVYREDARDAEGLIDAADEARFAASASGIAVAPSREEPDGPEGSGPELAG